MALLNATDPEDLRLDFQETDFSRESPIPDDATPSFEAGIPGSAHEGEVSLSLSPSRLQDLAAKHKLDEATIQNAKKAFDRRDHVGNGKI